MYPDLFTKDFETNKRILMEKSPVPLTKKERNKIAGYIVRLIKLRDKQEKVQEESQEAEETQEVSE